MFCCRALIFIVRSETFFQIEFENSSALLLILDSYAFPYGYASILLSVGARQTGALSIFFMPYFSRIPFPSVGTKIDFPYCSFFQTSCCGGCGKSKRQLLDTKIKYILLSIYTCFFVSTFTGYLQTIARCSTVQDTLLDEMKTLG